ncbi:glycosyltransferase family 2 protein [soil metagenome]
MPTVSLVIVAQDEERTIGRVIDAARSLVDEIIVVDSGSSDRTKEIAAEKGALVQHQDWLGFAKQKNFAIDLAKSDWVLSLDADEILTDDLVAEMASLLKSDSLNQFDGYKIPRILYIGEQPVSRGGFYPDAQLRLFKRGKGKFGDRLVHEAIKMTGPVAMLKKPMHHYAYKTVDDFAMAMDKYAKLSAQEYFNRGNYGLRASSVSEFVKPKLTFLYRYFLRGGILEGELGFKLTAIYSDYVRKKIFYLRQLATHHREGSNND